ncbi:hypothetical protein BE21_47720 [Sorangium cellulosum]|uniref:Uncharacterized protein n=1 Tax=Sorangium cellulosum TaxID=56 RepID=A0A150THU7_SORCE|nr:hypothetical protein BE21_47720 [Sorangium cellulosum]
MASIDDLLKPFACALYAKASTLNSVGLSSSQRARLLESMSDDIKKCTNFIEPEVSEAALAEAEHLQVDLRTRNWHDQPSFDAGREIFHFEHVVPVSAIRAACCDQQSESAVLAVLKGRLRVAWILKSEDAELTLLGHRSNRPDPDAAYRKAGIQLVARRSA